MYIDLESLPRGDVYAAMIQCIIPRPVAWVLSENENGTHNLAPFSYFNAVSSEPPLIMLSIGKKPDGSEKDTRRNIRERAHFVVHIPHREQAPAVTASSAGLERGQSEVEQLGMELTVFEGSALPRLSDCRIALACERYQILDIGPIPQALILGRVNRIYVDDAVLAKGGSGARPRVLAEKVDPLGRLGGADYTTLGEILTIPRPG